MGSMAGHLKRPVNTRTHNGRLQSHPNGRWRQFIKSGITAAPGQNFVSGWRKWRALRGGLSGRGRVRIPLSVDWWRIDPVCLSSILRSEPPIGASPPVSTAILRRRSPSVPRLGRNWTNKMRFRSSFRRRKTSQRQPTTGTEQPIPMAATGEGGGGAGRRIRRRAVGHSTYGRVMSESEIFWN